MSTLKYYDGTNWTNVNSNITGDTLPIGAEIDFNGTTVPAGWEEVQDYSTNEIKTGKKWIDGKPIYRKVFTGTGLASNTVHNVALNISNFKQGINLYGVIIGNTREDLVYSLNHQNPNYLNNVGYITSANLGSNKLLLWCGTYLTSNSKFDYRITVEYTKTTD